MKRLTQEQAKKFIPTHEDGFTHLDPHYYSVTSGDDGWDIIEYYTNKPKREYAGTEGEQFVYVLSNKYMPGIVKIGFTTLNPYDRANILSKSTGVPDDFEMDFAYQCINGRKLEKAVHEKLKDNRIRKQREFFTVSLDTAIEIINLLGEQVR
jgi:hypothetical protein